MNFLILGGRSEGKTHLAAWLAKQHYNGVVIFDTRCMVQGVIVWNLEELEDAIEAGDWRQAAIVYRPSHSDIEEEFSELCERLFEPPYFPRGKFALVLDEASTQQNAHSVNEKLEQVIRQHPLDEILIIQTSHSLQDWHRTNRDLVDEVYCFRLKGRSLVAAVDHLDLDAEQERLIATLPEHHCVRFFGRDQMELWSEPERWYTPLFRSEQNGEPDENDDDGKTKDEDEDEEETPSETEDALHG